MREMLPKRTRLKTFDYLGPYRYFVTFCTANREPLLEGREVVDSVLCQFLRAAGEEAFAIIAYCFMRDHLHLLVEGCAEHADFKRFAKSAKQYSGFYYKRAHGRVLWQPSYYERVLRDEEDTWSVARYIVENPLAAGLTKAADAYPFLGSCTVDLKDLLFFVSCAKPWARE